MITFKAFLAEARMAPLYHTTGVDEALSIVKGNVLEPTKSLNYRKSQRHNKPTNFFSRDIKHAKWYGKHMFGNDFVIFVVDQQKLNHSYKIQPIRNWSKVAKSNVPIYHATSMDYGNEFEEIVDKPITNFLKYVDKVLTGEYSFEPMYGAIYERNWSSPIKVRKFEDRDK